ncbi:MAG: FMN-dependent NADH-azoreductase [Gammaproteobacteria bacterium]
MSTLLYVESSPRKSRSHSIKVADAFLKSYAAANPGDTIDRIDLWDLALPEFDGERINAKYAVMHGDSPSGDEVAAWNEVQTLFDRFNAADKYLFSVPMWNFSIPYKLKHYIDVITQPGMAWSFSPDSGYSGLVNGSVVAIYSSAGVYHDGSGAEAFDLQKPYFENWLGFIGLTDVSRVIVAPTLEAPENVEAAVKEATDNAIELAAKF